MPTKLNRQSLENLTVDDAIKTDLLSLFDSITENEKTINDLRAKVPGDSQQIVEKTDFEKFKLAQTELAAAKKELAEKLATQNTGDGFSLSGFSIFGI